MTIANEIISTECRVSKSTVELFNLFITRNLFDELPKGATTELTHAFTTLSYLQHRYVIKVPHSTNVLSIIIRANYFKDELLPTTHLKGDFAFLNADMDEQLSVVKTLEGSVNTFKNTFLANVMTQFR